ncbi:glycosyltransferase family 4 protein [Magnetovibrio sp.]|uniref:glycosyltransferase family 4 protein n=1 Tax=Magnetovibrio sp. TaxID=2024836 RepID=UPI002F942206
MSGERKPAPGTARPKLLFTVTEDWAFCSHRLPTALAARDAGYDVVVTARMRDHREQIEALGFRTVEWAIRRESQNPFFELSALLDLIRIYKAERPDVTYHVALKSIMYGAIAARLCGVGASVNLFSGLGVVFISNSLWFRFIRALATPLLRWAMRPSNVRLQVQNADDRAMLNGLGIGTAERTDLVPGSGLDLENFPETPETDTDTPMAMLVARMLWDKGIGELVEAARHLKARGIKLRIVLVGNPDPANPASIPEPQLKAWVDEGLIEWWGRRNDVAEILKQSHIAVLPSYREGMPRSLLEAAAIGRPLVAFDAVGCRDLVRDGKNGFLVPFQDSEALADALHKLTDDADLRRRLGHQARLDIERTYSADAIRSRICDILSSLRPG